MRVVVKTMMALILIAAMAFPLYSCEKIKSFFEDVDVDESLQEGLDKVGLDNDNEGKNRQSRIDGALAKAKDTQKAYNINRSYAGMSEQPDGTKYIVDANGYYVEFTVQEGNLVDTNPEEIPTSDPYKKKTKSFDKATGELVEGIRKDVTIYLPDGKE